MTHSQPRTRIVTRAIGVLVVGTLFALCACAPHQAELSAANTVLNAASDGFSAWDEQHQTDIARGAKTLEQGTADLQSYRRKREPILAAFTLAYKTLAAAALSPSDLNVALALSTIQDLKTAVLSLGASWPKDPAAAPGVTP